MRICRWVLSPITKRKQQVGLSHEIYALRLYVQVEGTASCDRNPFKDCLTLRTLKAHEHCRPGVGELSTSFHYQANGFIVEFRPELIPEKVFAVLIGVRDVRERPSGLVSPGDRLLKETKAVRGAHGKGLRCKLVRDHDAPLQQPQEDKPVCMPGTLFISPVIVC